MTHLAANLEALSRLNPKIAERVAAAEPVPCEVGIAKDGAAWIESGGVAQCSRKEPLREALHLAESVDIIRAGLFVVLGFGAGHHITELAQRVQRAGIIVVLEPDMGMLRRALELTDFSAVFRSCVVYICDGTEGEGDLAAMYHGCESAFIAGVSIIRHAPSIERVAPVPIVGEALVGVGGPRDRSRHGAGVHTVGGTARMMVEQVDEGHQHPLPGGIG